MSDVVIPDEGAVHEAGHAVVAEELGYEVTRVEIYTDGYGFCGFRLPVGDLNSCGGRYRRLAVAAAGQVAEEIYYDLPPDRDEVISYVLSLVGMHPDDLIGEGDRGDAALILGEPCTCGRTVEAEAREAMDVAEEILRERWEDVLTLAATLVPDDSHAAENAAILAAAKRRRP